MTMTDPIADMLTRIRNANAAMHDSVRMPGSKLKAALAQVLEREGYIAGFEVSDDAAASGPVARDQHEVHATTATDVDRGAEARLEAGAARLHASAERLPRVLGGMGVAVLSHEPRADDRPRGAPAQGGRRGALLCLVSAGAPSGRPSA